MISRGVEVKRGGVSGLDGATEGDIAPWVAHGHGFPLDRRTDAVISAIGYTTIHEIHALFSWGVDIRPCADW